MAQPSHGGAAQTLMEDEEPPQRMLRMLARWCRDAATRRACVVDCCVVRRFGSILNNVEAPFEWDIDLNRVSLLMVPGCFPYVTHLFSIEEKKERRAEEDRELLRLARCLQR